jgi:hypothetical protein
VGECEQGGRAAQDQADATGAESRGEVADEVAARGAAREERVDRSERRGEEVPCAAADEALTCDGREEYACADCKVHGRS